MQHDRGIDPADYAAFVLDAFGAADYELNLATGALRHSPRLSVLFGYPADLPLTVEHCRARYHPDDRADVVGIIAELLACGEARFQHEYRLLLPDGTQRWLLTRGEIVRNPAGQPVFARGAALDISESKRAEMARRESEERLRLALDIAELGTWTWDLATGKGDLDDRSSDIVGLPEGEIADTFAAQRLCIHPEDLPRIDAEIAAGMASRDAFDLAYRVIHQDGSIHYIASRARVLTDAAGRPVRLVGTNRDVTSEREGELRLRASEAEQRFLLQLNDRLRLLADPEAILFEAARTLGEHLGASRVGYAEDQGDGETIVVTRNYTDGVPGIEGRYHYDDYGPGLLRSFRVGRTVVRPDIANDASLSEAEKAAHAALQLGATVNVPLLRAGRLVAVLFMHHRTARNWTAGELALLEAVAVRTWDAVERARAEAALQESEQRFRLMADAVPQIIWLTDAEGRTEFFNKQWSRYTGVDYYPETAARVAVEFVHPDDAGPTMAAFDQARRSGGIFSVEHRIRSAAGDYRWFLVRGEPYRDRQTGAIIRWFGASIDIHDRKHTEARLQQLYAQEQAARAEAEEANRLKDEFLATVSHELRTPLTAFLGYAELLQRRKRDEAYVARTVEKMVQSARAQAQLIDDLLDVSRIVSGKLRIELQPIDLVDVVQSALDTVRPAVEAKGLRLQITLDPEASRVLGDAGRLQQVVWNLLSNAVKFTPPGGRVAVELMSAGGSAELRVRDTGQGIPADFLPYVFDRFRQADSSSKRIVGGLGLGLAIVRHLVELHGGTVEVASDGPDQGATFTIRLPLTRASAPAPPGADPHAEPDGETVPLHGLRVLVVDDQPAIVDLLVELLASDGAVVRACTSAQEALALLRSWRPDLLVSDIAMPEADGYWLIQHVRSLPPDQGGATPALALTAYVRTDDRRRVLAAGFQQYLPKPVEADALREVVGRLAGVR
ncbi:MAG TPA: PAS domain-containing protein [Roseiflexaceae bacterium]|nr:PAS domain-containing protein [Roseiflexaceae bacterium]